MEKRKFARLVRRGILTWEELADIIWKSRDSGEHPEELLLRKGVPKQEILFCLSEYYGYPFLEYDEGTIVSQNITRGLDTERLKQALWFPLSVLEDKAEVVAYDPHDPAVIEDIKATLGVRNISFILALPHDLVRIIEHNQDLNPRFSPSAGRTPLAKVRTFFADRRSLYACYRTTLAQGRTGLAFFRTGISFITIALVLLRVFSLGYLTVLETALLVSGIVMSADGLRWYLPARRVGAKPLECTATEATNGSTVLQASWTGDGPLFARSGAVHGAEELRAGWNDLSPVMRRRFLASDRTDFAEERTSLACFRTKMARARTGLAFTRTGIAFMGLGIALLRLKNPPLAPLWQRGVWGDSGLWTMFDIFLVVIGISMTLEGFYWYFAGRSAGRDGFHSVRKAESKPSLWEVFFPPMHRRPVSEKGLFCLPPVTLSQSPGIWATTGLALERTMLAERRNVMARLRTVMARSRTGLAFIRTGMSISAVGAGLLVYFGASSMMWATVYGLLILAGLVFIADGLYWHLPAEKTRKQFPYCFCDVEIVVPDYGRPARLWSKAVFSHDDF